MRKHKHLAPVDLYEMIKNDIRELHYCICSASYKLLLASIERKWSQDSRMDAFRIYFFKQWIHSQYSKWQLKMAMDIVQLIVRLKAIIIQSFVIM
jgi:hypothetical protein